jgi:hypothetical protein
MQELSPINIEKSWKETNEALEMKSSSCEIKNIHLKTSPEDWIKWKA